MILTQEKIVRWLVLFSSELLGTATLVFLGCLGCVDKFEHFHLTHLSVCLCFGFAVLVSLSIFGCVSMAHISPMVTLAAVVYKLLDIPTALVYVIGQMLGGLIGYALVRVAIMDDYLSNPNGFCVSKPGLDIGRSFLVEFIISFLLISIVCSIWDPRNKNHHDSFPLRFGFAVTVFAFVGGPFGGGSMNPARSFGPALYNWNWENHWIYWVAPFSASLIGSLFHRFCYYQEENNCSGIIRNGSIERDDKIKGNN